MRSPHAFAIPPCSIDTGAKNLPDTPGQTSGREEGEYYIENAPCHEAAWNIFRDEPIISFVYVKRYILYVNIIQTRNSGMPKM
jgi:hypothetical protein